MWCPECNREDCLLPRSEMRGLHGYRSPVRMEDRLFRVHQCRHCGHQFVSVQFPLTRGESERIADALEDKTQQSASSERRQLRRGSRSQSSSAVLAS